MYTTGYTGNKGHTTSGKPASLPQRELVTKLLGEVSITPEALAEIVGNLNRPDLSKAEISPIIDRLIGISKAQRQAKKSATTAAPTAPHVSPLDDLPDTRFCVPVSELSQPMADMAGNSDLLFGEMKSYKGWRYMNVLHGSHPVFTREKITGVWAKEVADILRKDLLAYVRLYGTEFKCCSSCGAELSDGISRQLQLGPECRKKFGL